MTLPVQFYLGSFLFFEFLFENSQRKEGQKIGRKKQKEEERKIISVYFQGTLVFLKHCIFPGVLISAEDKDIEIPTGQEKIMLTHVLKRRLIYDATLKMSLISGITICMISDTIKFGKVKIFERYF